MFCPGCGSKIGKQEKFCKYCGKQLLVTDNLREEEKITDTDFIETYIGSNYKKINSTPFSFPTFLFGAIYFIYRKMWLYSFIWLFFICLVAIFTNGYVLFLVSIFLNSIFAVNFSSVYKNFASAKINKIKKDNASKTNKELLPICAKKGGTSVLAIILFSFFIIGLLIFLFFFFLLDEILTNHSQTRNKYRNNNVLQYELPVGFSSTTRYSHNFQRFHYRKDDSHCEIEIRMQTNYSFQSAEDYLKYSLSVNQGDKMSDILTKKINNIYWSYVTISNNDTTTYYYVTKQDYNFYEVEYSIYQDNSKYCTNSHDKFINSLNFANTNKDFNSI